jgi:hypothetical protein
MLKRYMTDLAHANALMSRLSHAVGDSVVMNFIAIAQGH